MENPGFFLSFFFIYIYTYFFLWNMDWEDEIPGGGVFYLYSYASFYEHGLGGRDSAVFYWFEGGDYVLESWFTLLKMPILC